MQRSRPPRVFTTTGAVVLLGVCAAITVVLLVDAFLRSGLANTLLLAPWPLLVLWGVYVFGAASDVRADRAGVRVQNLLRRTWLPWAHVERITMRWLLELTIDDGEVVRCFGGPARTRPRRLAPGRVKEHVVGETEDGIAALHRLRSEAEPRSHARIERTWDLPATVVLVVLVIWAVVAVVATR